MSIELPDGEIARTLPEQVGKNAKDIKHLKEGYNQISDIKILSGELIVTLQDGTEIDAGPVVGITSVAFNDSRHLIITYDNGTSADLGLVKGITSLAINASQHIIVTYDDGSTQDIGALGDFSSADFLAKTLSQSQANYTKTFSFSTSNPNISVTNVYNRFIIVNKMLYIIANIKLTNTSGSDVVFSNVPTAYVVTNDCPEIYNNVYDMKGDLVGMASTDIFIAGDQAIVMKGTPDVSGIRAVKQMYSIIAYNTSSAVNKTINVFFEKATNDSDITIAAGASIYLSGRIALSLL